MGYVEQAQIARLWRLATTTPTTQQQPQARCYSRALCCLTRLDRRPQVGEDLRVVCDAGGYRGFKTTQHGTANRIIPRVDASYVLSTSNAG